jgi:hypothetical protein
LILPTGFDDPWDLTFQGKLTETDAAQLETAHIASGAATPLTAIDLPYLVFPILLSLNHALLSHYPS